MSGVDWPSGNSGKFQMGWAIFRLGVLVEIDTHTNIYSTSQEFGHTYLLLLFFTIFYIVE
jgi:hypothetical protein